MAPSMRSREKIVDRSSSTKMAGKMQRHKPEDLKRSVLQFCLTAYARSPDQPNCYICGVLDHMEHFCPYNYMYGRCDYSTCRGDCPPGDHSITSPVHRKHLRRFVRVSNLPPGFRGWELNELFSAFGPLLVSDVPKLNNDICYCTSQIPMTFGVVVFKKRADAEKAINELNGCDVGGSKIRVDWVYPSV